MPNKRRTNLNICSWNANGIARHKLELEVFTRDQDIAIMCIQETHLHPSDDFGLEGFQIERQDRPGGRRGGGVLIAIRHTICYARLNDISTDDLSEVVGIVIRIGPHPVHIFSLNQAPNRNCLSGNIVNILKK